MKKLSVTLFLCIGLTTVMGMSEEFKELAATLHKTCVAESGVDEALISKVNTDRMFPEDQNLKCYLKCLMVQPGCMNEDGSVDVEACIAIIPDEHREAADPVVRKCAPAGAGDPCENAWLSNKCVLETVADKYTLI